MKERSEYTEYSSEESEHVSASNSNNASTTCTNSSTNNASNNNSYNTSSNIELPPLVGDLESSDCFKERTDYTEYSSEESEHVSVSNSNSASATNSSTSSANNNNSNNTSSNSSGGRVNLDQSAFTRDLERMAERIVVAPRGKRKRARGQHIDWRLPHNKDRMDKALEAYFEMEPLLRKNAIRSLARVHSIPRITFKDRLTRNDPYAVPKLGRKTLFSDNDMKAICDAVLAMDNLNSAKKDSAIVDLLADQFPEYEKEQVRDAWRKTIKRQNPRVGTYESQDSSKDRTGAITEHSQRAYFKLVDHAMEMTEKRSAPEGEARDGPTRTLWRKLSPHFVLNLDECGHLASTGKGKVCGDKIKKVHEVHTADSRVSITSVECGNAAGNDGPSVYLMTGEKMPKYVYLENQFGSTKWLQDNGAPPGSFVHMTPNAYMTNEAWDEIADRMSRRIREMTVIRDHPEFWIVLHFDGFKSHCMTYAAQEIFAAHKIICVKENSHTSSINQAFDKEPAKRAKAENRRWLPLVRDTTNLLRCVDQWSLLLVVMTGQNGGRRDAWTAGFKRVNLHPDHKRPIEVWLSEINQWLVASGSTETADPTRIDLEYLRQVKPPPFYTDLTTSAKAEALLCMTADTFLWNIDDIKSLPESLKLAVQKGQALYKMFIFVQHMKSAIEQGLVQAGEVDVSAGVDRLLLAVSKAPRQIAQEEKNKRALAATGLGSYKILGDGKTVEEKWQTACLHRRRFADHAQASPYLDLAISPVQQKHILEVDARTFGIGQVLKSACDVNVGKGLAVRKLNMLGEIEGVACITNNPARLRTLNRQCSWLWP
jgi:hypothetical protein